jgi:hypothetical protein
VFLRVNGLDDRELAPNYACDLEGNILLVFICSFLIKEKRHMVQNIFYSISELPISTYVR